MNRSNRLVVLGNWLLRQSRLAAGGTRDFLQGFSSSQKRHNRPLRKTLQFDTLEQRLCMSGDSFESLDLVPMDQFGGSGTFDEAPALNPAAVHTPFIPLHAVDLNSADYVRFKAWVDQAVAGNPGYEFSATDAAIMYRLTGQIAYANLAISMVEADVTAAENAIAAGNRPSIASDSYYDVGNVIRNLSVTYDWAYDLLTQTQRNRWGAYAEQAVWNVWNYTQAQWGGVSYPWSGWSVNNPGNNYFYSFVKATMHWGLASQSSQWLNLLRNDKLPSLVAYFQNLPGGGSLEGTGYGTSHKELFSLYRTWKEATGEDFAAQSSHVRDSIDYWVHATLPTLDRFAPIGDQARVSSAPLYDYQEHLMLEAVALNPNTPQAARGTWWLNNNSVVQMQHGFNYRHALLREQQPESRPAELVYYAQGTGHLFARTSWDTDATWLSFVAGKYNESHAHQDQGSFSLFQEDWLAVTENINSHSGIQQGTDVHNVIRFVKNGTTIRQTYNSQSSMSFTDVNGLLSIQANLNNAYSGSSADVQGWQRDLTFNRATNLVRIHDQFQVGNGVSAIWQINVPVQPIIQGDGTIKAGNLLITPVTPGVQVSIVDWRTVDATEFPSGWKIELRGASEYTVDLAVDHAVQAARGSDLLVIEPTGNLSVANSRSTAFDPVSIWGSNTSAIATERYQVADFNGDGLSDVISFGTDGGFDVRTAKSSGGFNVAVRWGQNGADIGADRYKVGDFNGDGLSDVMSMESNAVFYVWTAKAGGGFNNYQRWGSNGADIGMSRYKLGDFNADGRTDIASFEANGGFYVWTAKPAGGFNTVQKWGTNGGDIGASRYKIGDFNGDHRSDVMSLEANGGMYVWTANANGGFNNYKLWGMNSGDIGASRYKLGDFNGDGRTDVISFESNGRINVWTANNADRFDDGTQWAANGQDIGSDRYQVGDFNGDGRTDIASLESNGGIYVWLAKNTVGFVSYSRWGSFDRTLSPNRFIVGSFADPLLCAE